MKKVKPIAWVILCLPVLYAAIAAAAAYKQDTNLFDLMTRFSHVLKHPTLLHWTGYTIPAMKTAAPARNTALPNGVASVR